MTPYRALFGAVLLVVAVPICGILYELGQRGYFHFEGAGNAINAGLRTYSPLEMIGECPWCGAPIYGWRRLRRGEQPVVAYSCTCHERVEELVAAAIETRERVRRRLR